MGAGTVPAVTEALRHDDRQVRAGAAAVLEGFGPKARGAVPALREAALDDNKSALPFVRAIVAAAELETIASFFADSEMPLRDEFGEALVAAGEDALPFLEALRQDDDASVRRDTLVLFRRCPDVPLDWILKATGDEDDGVATAALAQLGKGVPAHKALPVLARAARDDALRMAALRMLVDRGDGLPTLEELSTDESAAVRAATLEVLGGAGAEAFGILAEGLKDEDPRARAAAANALRQLGAAAKDAIPALRSLLSDDDGRVRCAAAGSLGKLHAEEAVPDLARLFGSADATDRGHAALALASMGEKGAAALAPFLSHPDRTYGDLARSALESMGEKAVPAVAPLLDSVDAKSRHDAAALLAKLGGVDALAGALRAKDAAERIDAAWALGTMQARAAKAVPDLVKALEDGDARVVVQVAWTLGQIGPAARDALKALEKLRADGKHRAIVDEAIRRIGGK